VQTEKEAMSGDAQAARLLAKENASSRLSQQGPRS